MASGYVVALVMVDLALVAGAIWLVMRLLSAEPSKPANSGTLAAVVAAVLFLCSLPFEWAPGNGDLAAAGLTSPMAFSPLVVAAVLLAAVTMVTALVGERRSGRAQVSGAVLVIVGGAWVIVALSSLVVAAGVNRQVSEAASIAAGPALWLCGAGGLAAVLAGAARAGWSRPPRRLAKSTQPPTSSSVDEWGVVQAPVGHEAGDEW